MNSGIYSIYCINNDKIYVGSSKNIKKRWNEHKRNLKNNKHCNQHLQNCYNKYGKNSLEFKIIEITNTDLIIKEANYLFNIQEERRLNLAPITELIPITKELIEKKKRVAPRIGHKHTEEIKKYLSIINTGKKFTEQHKKNLSEARKGKIPWNKGIPRTLETKEKISMSKKGRKLSDDHKKAISISNKGKKLNDRQKLALINSNKSRKGEKRIKKEIQ